MGRKAESVSSCDLAWSLAERSQTDLRSLHVLQDGEWRVEFAADLFHGSNRSKSFFVRTVREVDPKDIDTALGECLDHLLRICRRPECGDNLGTFGVHIFRHRFLHHQGTQCPSLAYHSPTLPGTNGKGPGRTSRT